MRKLAIVLVPLLLPLLLLVGTQLSSRAYADSGVDRWAVVVGIADYAYVSDIDYCDDDARDVAAQLESIFGVGHVKLLIDSGADKDDIRSSITNWLDTKEDSNDVVVFFASAHGIEGGYLAAHDSLTTSYANDISPSELDSWLDSLESRKVTVILDYCRSVDALDNLRDYGRVLMSCSNKWESCWSSGQLGHGRFSNYIIEAFSDLETVDVNRDHNISAEEIFDYAMPKVVSYSLRYGEPQTPIIDDNHVGELALFTTATVTFDSNPRVSAITIDGTRYSQYQLPVSLTWVTGTIHTVKTSESVVSSGQTYLFSTWSDGSTLASRTIIVAAPLTYTASYGKQQYPLTIISEFGEPVGEGLYDEDSTASFSVPATIDLGDGSRCRFVGWSLPSGPITSTTLESTIEMVAPTTVVAHWQLQHYLSVEVGPADTTTAWGEGWHDEVTEVVTEMAPEVVAGDSGIRYTFKTWSVDGGKREGNPIKIVMDSPHAAKADYEKQYQLTVESQHGDPQGTGWYAAASEVPISVKSPQGVIISRIFVEWSEATQPTEPSTTVLVDKPKTVTAAWRADYLRLYIVVGVVVFVVSFSLTYWFVIRAGRRRF